MENPQELNQLAKELGRGGHAEGSDSAATARLDQWLKTLVERGGSDLLLVEGAPPCIRVQGEVRKIEPGFLDGTEMEAARAFSNQPSSRTGTRGGGDSWIAYQRAEAGRAEFAAFGGQPGPFAPRISVDWWAGGLGQIHHAFGADSGN